MTSQPEKLFRDKLENFQRPAPVAAWDRIEAGLDKSNNKKVWMKIAAGLLLLAIATFIVWPGKKTDKTETLAESNTATPDKKSVEEKIIPQQQLPVIAEQSIVTKKNKSNGSTDKASQKTEQKQPVLVSEKTETLPENNFVIEPIKNTAVAVQESATTSSSTTIVYTADEVNSKFMKKNLQTDATDEEKKPSGIQKLMGLAYDLKNNENGMRDLRQKKDEILALNFLNNEDKTEKRNN